MEELAPILDAGESLFWQYGTRSVTMSDIAKHLGMSKKTLYQHIENKDDLVLKIVQRYISRDTDKLCVQIEEAENAVEEMVKILIRVRQTMQGINPAVILDLQRFHRMAWTYLEAHQKNFIIGVITKNLERGVQEGLYRKDLKIDFISKIYIASLPIFASDNIFPLDQYPRAELHFQWLNYHMHGIVSTKGLELWEGYLQNINN